MTEDEFLLSLKKRLLWFIEDVIKECENLTETDKKIILRQAHRQLKKDLKQWKIISFLHNKLKIVSKGKKNGKDATNRQQAH